MTNRANNDERSINTMFDLEDIFPDATQLFSSHLEPLQSISDSALIVLDTNVLLIPYLTGKSSLESLGQVYRKLVGRKQLVIPARVAREFVRNRSEKIKQLFQQVSRRSNINVSDTQYPLLESIGEYKSLIEAEQELQLAIKKYRSKISDLKQVIKNWNVEDPVSVLYSKCFTPEIIVDVPDSRDQLAHELRQRYARRQPPGFKDEGKPDEGIGDFAIWKTILHLGKTLRKHIVFVSGEEKTDWWYRSEDTHLYVRAELSEEFRRETEGMSFHMINLNDLLEIFGANEDVVSEVKEAERLQSAIATSATPEMPTQKFKMGFAIDAEAAVYHWLVARGEGPVSVLQEGGDFEVNTSNGNILVDVKVGRPENIGRRLADLYRRASNIRHMGRSFSTFMVVFVSDDESMAQAVAAQTKEWIPQFANWFSVVCGFLDAEEKFVPLELK